MRDKDVSDEFDINKTGFRQGTLKSNEIKCRNGSTKWTLSLTCAQERDYILGMLAAASQWFFENYYDIGRELGSGAYATVRECTELNGKSTGQKYACKVVDLTKLVDDELKILTSEVSMLLECRGHENIISVIDVFQTKHIIHIIMDLLSGGDLFDYITSQPEQKVSEPVAKHIMLQLFAVLRHLQGKNIAHRDLKPENILLEDKTVEYPKIKLTDFGLAGRLVKERGISAIDDHELERFGLGTVGYMAPEILLRKPHDTSVDMFACGVLLYVLLSGKKPFNGRTHEEICLKSSVGNFSFPAAMFKNVTPEAVSLIKALLQLRPHMRPTPQAALCHRWFKTEGKWAATPDPGVRKSILRRFKTMIYAVIFTNSWVDINDADNSGYNALMSPRYTHPVNFTQLLSPKRSVDVSTANRRIGSLRDNPTRASRRLSVLSDNTSVVLELAQRNTTMPE